MQRFIVVFFFIQSIHSGYTGVHANGDGNKGLAECPFEFYKTWVKNPLEAQRMSEKVTRPTIGVECCPVAGIPTPDEFWEIEESTSRNELTNGLNLSCCWNSCLRKG